MGLSTFIGGVHPYEGKELSADKPIQVIQPKGELVYPLSQHIGAPAKPLVAKGDKVLVGQKIAEAGGFISANVICSVSGTVKGIEPRLVANGAIVQSIIVENDNEYTAIEGFGEKRDYTKLSKEEIRNIVKEAGIVGLGGAGFPTNVKLAPKDDNAIDHIIVNAAECEPYLTSDYRLMMEQPERLIGGIKVMLSMFPNAKGVIGIEENKPEAIKLLEGLVKDEPKISVCPLKTKYPQGGERFLIYAVTGGREISSAMLPADAGCIVDNVDTVISIYNAVCESTPLIRKIITVTGDAVKNPQNFQVPLGMCYREILEAAGGGLIFGAFFMATDYVTSPITAKGQIVFGICLGILTGLFRIFGSGAEGVSYAIIFCNMLVPLIEKVTLPTAFGKGGKKNGSK